MHKPIPTPITKKQKGFVIFTAALLLMFTIPVVGLAIDAGFLFAVKARLQSAVDAAFDQHALRRAFHRIGHGEGLLEDLDMVLPHVPLPPTQFRVEGQSDAQPVGLVLWHEGIRGIFGARAASEDACEGHRCSYVKARSHDSPEIKTS